MVPLELELMLLRIARLPGAFVDVGYKQGADAMRAKLEGKLEPEWLERNITYVIEDGSGSLNRLRAAVLPYELPTDYVAFLEYFGGLSIEGTDFEMSLFGHGPLCEVQYEFFLGDSAGNRRAGERGCVSLGVATIQDFAGNVTRYHQMDFDLGLGGPYSYGMVTVNHRRSESGIAGFGRQDSQEQYDPEAWRVIAPSFTAFLSLVADEGGRFSSLHGSL